jgi:hypothetical protein
MARGSLIAYVHFLISSRFHVVEAFARSPIEEGVIAFSWINNANPQVGGWKVQALSDVTTWSADSTMNLFD